MVWDGMSYAYAIIHRLPLCWPSRLRCPPKGAMVAVKVWMCVFFSDEDRDEKLDTGNMCKDIYRVICICNYIITFTIYTYDMVILYLQCKKERQQYKEYCCMPFSWTKNLAKDWCSDCGRAGASRVFCMSGTLWSLPQPDPWYLLSNQQDRNKNM